MIERIIDISQRPARLSVREGLLVIECEEGEKSTTPLEELAALVVSHPRVSYTHAVLSGIAAHGGAFVACDEKHLPAGMLLPLNAHYVQAERFARQARASEPLKKRLWQQIVTAKVLAQAAVLRQVRGDDQGLAALARTVRSGDPQNIESRASCRYWPALFNAPHFRRNTNARDQNQHLNYGYAVLRAIVGRALCACGLHPSLGLHHHNRYDAFCLADDLMEPFRPLVDRTVARWVDAHGSQCPLDREAKGVLLESLTGRVELNGELRTLFDVARRAAASLAAAFQGKSRKLALPRLS